MRREDAERFVEQVHSLDPELASYLRIDEWELETGAEFSPGRWAKASVNYASLLDTFETGSDSGWNGSGLAVLHPSVGPYLGPPDVAGSTVGA